MQINVADNLANQRLSQFVAVAITVISIALAGLISFWFVIGIAVAVFVYFLLRRDTRRQWRAAQQPTPDAWRAILNQHVTFYLGLDDAGRERFESMMKVFLSDVQITGIRTDVDETTRVLVAASAVIPAFGFDDFEYSRLGEVLIYPDSFNPEYKEAGQGEATILGMVGDAHLSGVMILSKPSLIAGFQNDRDKRNVGIHEFSHLIDKADGSIDGVPPSIPAETIDPWVRWVGKELRRDGSFRDIDDYAYTNEAEYFAVLSEYFFENPSQLERQHPKLFAMMKKMYHQNPIQRRRKGRKLRRRRKVRRNDPCPCGSGEKYKRCCRMNVVS